MVNMVIIWKSCKKNKDLDEIKKLFKKTTIYVVRCDKNNNLQESAPCQSCVNTITNLNIKRVVFSSKDDTFVSTTPSLLQINHISAGNKYIKNKK